MSTSVGAGKLTAPVQSGDRNFALVLSDVTHILEEEQIDHVVFGGLASSALGRPRTTRDIDIFVRADVARRALETLSGQGYSTDLLDDKWIYKAFKSDVPVDLIFSTRYGIHLDQLMIERSRVASYQGVSFRAISPEDLLVIKAISCDEASPHHWYDALGLIINNTEFDWDYLVHRAGRAHRRVASLLLYAQSIDYYIPASAMQALLALSAQETSES